MTLKIEVLVPENYVADKVAGDYLAGALAAIGYTRSAGATAAPASVPAPEPALTDSDAVVRQELTEKPKATRSRKAADKPQISTGEERVGPEDDEATKAQDAADEAAESAARTKLTHDDVRQAASRYGKQHGLAAAAKNVPVILGCGITDLPDDQEALAEAVAKIDEAAKKGPPKADEQDDEAFDSDQPVYTKDDVKAAMIAYGKKYDGTANPADMANAKIDCGKVFMSLFGEDVKMFSQVPSDAESCARAVEALQKATRDNPYKREAK